MMLPAEYFSAFYISLMCLSRLNGSWIDKKLLRAEMKVGLQKLVVC